MAKDSVGCGRPCVRRALGLGGRESRQAGCSQICVLSDLCPRASFSPLGKWVVVRIKGESVKGPRTLGFLMPGSLLVPPLSSALWWPLMSFREGWKLWHLSLDEQDSSPSTLGPAFWHLPFPATPSHLHGRHSDKALPTTPAPLRLLCSPSHTPLAPSAPASRPPFTALAPSSFQTPALCICCSRCLECSTQISTQPAPSPQPGLFRVPSQSSLPRPALVQLQLSSRHSPPPMSRSMCTWLWPPGPEAPGGPDLDPVVLLVESWACEPALSKSVFDE